MCLARLIGRAVTESKHTAAVFAYSCDLSQTALCSVTCVSLFKGRTNPLDGLKTPNDVASVLDSVYTPTHPNIHQKQGCGGGEREGGSGAREGGQRAQEAYSGFVAWKDQPTAEQAAGTPQRRDVFSKINSRACNNRTMNVLLWLDLLLFSFLDICCESSLQCCVQC